MRDVAAAAGVRRPALRRQPRCGREHPHRPD
ncbi:hypothetical protein [Streptomyces toxytricini]